jgi:plasmid stabilization system protein ParE
VPRRLIFSDDAIADLSAIRGWLTQPGFGRAARRTLSSIRASIRRLRRYPCLFALGEYPGVRELPCKGGYRALYRLLPDTGRTETAGDILILRVFGPGQDRNEGP